MALLLSVQFVSFTCLACAVEQRSMYIVHMAKSEMSSEFSHRGDWYGVSLQSVSESVEIIYSYDTVLHSYSTCLTKAEAKALETQPGVMSVILEICYELHTTRSPEFLGLECVSPGIVGRLGLPLP